MAKTTTKNRKNQLDLKKLELELEALAKKAGRKILKYKKELNSLGIQSKEAQGVVSEADLASEKLIIDYLSKNYPDIPILAEELFFEKFKGKKEAYDHFKNIPYLWVIDPLDGTNNFVHGLDYYAVCISLVVKGQPVVGVVHAPSRKETFIASKGNGVRFNGESYFEKKGRPINRALLSTGFAVEKGDPFNGEFKIFKRIMERVRTIRRMGSASLDLCFTSLGIYDGFWERGLAPWDLAAATVICREAGVRVTEYSGSKLNCFSSTILAARNPVYKTLKELIAE